MFFIMDVKRGERMNFPKKGGKKIPSNTVIFVALGAFILGLIIAWLFVPDFGDVTEKIDKEEKSLETCGDGSFDDTCSLDSPYYCEGDLLVRDASACGCPEFMERDRGMCTSEYETNSKDVTYDYVLRGEEKNITLTVYEGVRDYMHEKDKNIFYTEGEKISRRDFKLNAIDDRVQTQYILPLVKRIQNTAPGDKVNQARIAVSLVQHIPYGGSDEVVDLGNQQINYSRFPYEVLYDNEGICGEKTELMALLLKEIGYGTSFFFWPTENHESLGIKCPVEESFQNTGYCFVESTMPAIISDSELSYKGLGKLSDDVNVYHLSKGFSLPEDIYEYDDREKLQSIKRNDVFRKGAYENLQEKYGFKGEYRVT